MKIIKKALKDAVRLGILVKNPAGNNGRMAGNRLYAGFV
jgi:hypothetical protein